MNDSTPALYVAGVSKSFAVPGKGGATTPALVDIDLSVQRGEFISLIGPSGSGKTTLLRILAGLTPADEGIVEVAGEAVRGPGAGRAMVFQHFALLPWRTVLQNVIFPMRIQKVNRQAANDRARHYLQLVGLERFSGRYPHQLSGGMQQRVGLARALAVEPDVLLMDEPFGAIDAQQRELMQEELLRIWSENQKTIVFVTHDLDEAVYLSERIVLLSQHPGTVRSVIEVDLPKPRWEYDVRGHDSFVDVRRRIWSVLRGDALDEVRREVDDLER